MLFDSGLDINAKIVNRHTALYHATLFYREDIVEFLIERGADLEAPTGPWDWTPLQGAIVAGNGRQTARLLKHGADFKAHAKPKDAVFYEAGKFWSVIM